MTATEILEYLVVDSGAIIRGQGYSFSKLSKRICTVAEVLKEIRDSKSRSLLDSLPYEIEILTPSDSAMKAVAEVSKKTGDFAALSLTDLKLIALMYTLDVQVNGSSRIEDKIKQLKTLQQSMHTKSANKVNNKSNNSLNHHSNSTMKPAKNMESCGCCDHDNIDEITSIISDNTHNQIHIDQHILLQEQTIDSTQMDKNDDSSNQMNEHIIEYIYDDDDDDNDSNSESKSEEDDNEDGNDSNEEEEEEEEEEEVVTSIDDNIKDITNPVHELTIHTHTSVNDATLDNNANHNDTIQGQRNNEYETNISTDNSTTLDSNETMNTATTTTTTQIEQSVSIELNNDDEFPSLGSPPPHSSTTTTTSTDNNAATTTTSSNTNTNNINENHTNVSKPSFSWASIAASKNQSTHITTTTTNTMKTNVIPVHIHEHEKRSTAVSTNTSSIIDNSTHMNHFQNTHISANKNNNNSNASGNTYQSRILSSTQPMHNNTHNNTNNNDNNDDDNNTGWIDVKNISSYRANGMFIDTEIMTSTNTTTEILKKKRQKKYPVNVPAAHIACITTDFTMQNVMMQLGLPIMSVDGLIIKKVKKWVLRCIACTNIHYDLNRLFCNKCGGSYLTRVSCSIDQDTGKLKLHLKSNYQVNLQGTKFSLPKPGKMSKNQGKGGGKGGDLLLREDQLLSGIWKQKVNQNKKLMKSIFYDDDFLSTTSTTNGNNTNLNIQLNKIDTYTTATYNNQHMNSHQIVVGFGKKNPNAIKGRERRGKKRT